MAKTNVLLIYRNLKKKKLLFKTKHKCIKTKRKILFQIWNRSVNLRLDIQIGKLTRKGNINKLSRETGYY